MVPIHPFYGRLTTLAPTYLPGVNAVKDNRLKLILQYDGSAFHGWQIQSEERTVQGSWRRPWSSSRVPVAR